MLSHDLSRGLPRELRPTFKRHEGNVSGRSLWTPAGVWQLDDLRRRELKALGDDDRVSLAIVLSERVTRKGSLVDYEAVKYLARLKPPFADDDLDLLLHWAVPQSTWWAESVQRLAIGAAEQRTAEQREPYTDRLRQLVDTLRANSYAEPRKLIPRVLALLPSSSEVLDIASVSRSIGDEDGWSDVVRPSLVATFGTTPGAQAVLEHLAAATSGTKPTKKWLKQLDALAGSCSEANAIAVHLLDAMLDAPGRRIMSTYYGTSEAGANGYLLLLSGRNADVVRGAVWAVGHLDGESSAKLLGDLALRCGQSNGHNGWVEGEKVPNACITMLGGIATKIAIAQLAMLKATLRHQGLLKQATKALQQAAGTSGATPTEIVEGTIATFDLGPAGDRRQTITEADRSVDAVLSINDKGKPQLVWSEEPDAKPTRTPPAWAADVASDTVAALKLDLRELKKVIDVERQRLEELLREERSWPAADWRALYIDHPVTGWFGRRLLWDFEADGVRAIGLPRPGGAVVTADGTTLDLDAVDARVRPWHPIRSTTQEVTAVRRLLTEHEVRQPFKQAWREVYILTPAEADTRVYSNRFAGHILRYPQLFALLKERRWGTQFLYRASASGEAKRTFEAERVVASYYFDAIHPEGRFDSIEHCATDQVRFAGAGGTMDLIDVPPAVFSEAMRDVDLFVSVCTIGADPNWYDRGEDVFHTYWESYAFGDLSASAVTRRDALEVLLPKLRIASRCELRDKWLEVRGDLATYRIHLGSGNVMTETDRYVCIVAGRGKAPSKVYLPFDDDHMLALIVSKAFLLADDRKITDPAILHQIR